MSVILEETRPDAERRYLVAVIAATLLAAALRLFNLGGFGFFGDEYSTIDAAVGMTVTEPHWPLLFWISQGVGKIAGINEWTMRLAPAVMGIACIPLFYYAGRRTFGGLAMVLAGFLIAINHWHLFHSQSARFYTGVFLFSGLAICWLTRAIDTGRVSFAVAAAISVGISAAFHPTGIWPAVAFGAFCALAVLAPSLRGKISWPIVLAFFVPLVVAGVSIFLTAILTTSAFLVRSGGWGYSPAHFLLGWARSMELPLLAVAGCWLLWMLRAERPKGWFCLLVGIVPLAAIVAVAVLKRPVRPDYVFAAAPVWFILAGAGAAQVVAAASVPLAARTGLILALFIAELPSTASHHLENLTCDPRSAYGYLKQHGHSDDLYFHNFVPMLNYYTGFEYNKDPVTKKTKGQLSNDPAKLAAMLQDVTTADKTAWFLIRETRGGIGNDKLADWLAQHAKSTARYDAKRIDYEVSAISIYRYDPPGRAPKAASDEGRQSAD